MYTNCSDNFKTKINEDGRTFITFLGLKNGTGSRVIDNSIVKKITMHTGSNGGDSFAVGTTYSSYIEVELSDRDNNVYAGNVVYFGLRLVGANDVIPMGNYFIDNPTITETGMKFTAYDVISLLNVKIDAASSLYFGCTTQDVLNVVKNPVGHNFYTKLDIVVPDDFVHFQINSMGDLSYPFEGYTLREILGYIAGSEGYFVVPGRSDVSGNPQVIFKKYENNSIDVLPGKTFKATQGGDIIKINKIEVKNPLTNEGRSYQDSLISSNYGIYYENPLVVSNNAYDSAFQKFIQNVNGFTYRSGNVKFMGNCLIDPFDIITYHDKQNKTYTIPVFTMTHTCDGGLTTEITANTPGENDVSFSSNSTQGQVTTKLSQIEKSISNINSQVSSLSSDKVNKVGDTMTGTLNIIASSGRQGVYIKDSDNNTIGYISYYTLGTTENEGNSCITLGNRKAKGSDGNATGNFYIYNDSVNYSTVKASSDLTNNSVVSTLPSKSGTLATLDDVNSKQDTLTAGDNIDITNNVISATDTTYNVATTTADGLMSSADKTILDSVPTTYLKLTGGTATDTIKGQGTRKGFQILDENGVSVGNLYSYRVGAVGATGTPGQGALNLGNSKTSGNVGNAQGVIWIYSSGSGYAELKSTNSSGSAIINLPSSSGTLALSTSSSRFIKENIENMSDDEALKLLDLNIVSFDYKKGYGNKGEFGVIAEDVQNMFPQTIDVIDNYDEEKFDLSKGFNQPILSVDYRKFVPHLIKMVQMQQSKIEELESRINQLTQDN